MAIKFPDGKGGVQIIGSPDNYFSERVTLAGGFDADSVNNNLLDATIDITNSTIVGSPIFNGTPVFLNGAVGIGGSSTFISIAGLSNIATDEEINLMLNDVFN